METVDTKIGGGDLYSSVAIDSDNHPHISYYVSDDQSLRYAYHDGSQWQISVIDHDVWGNGRTSLALNSRNEPCISHAYRNWESGLPEELRYAHEAAGEWLTEAVTAGEVVGQWASLTLDDADQPHISYQDGLNQNLIYVHLSGTTWISNVIDSDITPWRNGSSITLDSTGWTKVAYNNGATGNLHYATWDGTGWTTDTVSQDEPGYECSLALDSGDQPVVVYVPTQSDDLR